MSGAMKFNRKGNSYTLLIFLFSFVALTFYEISSYFLSSTVAFFSFKSERKPDHSPFTLLRRYDWIEDEFPEFCKENINVPRPCKYSRRSRSCMNDKNKTAMFSRSHIYYYIFTRHFRNLQRPGFYVDITSNHPINASSTYFFDRCLGWSGLCIEPNGDYFEPIFRERSCTLIPTCISNQDGSKVQFNFRGEQGGILSTDYKFKKKKHFLNIVRELRCTTMEKVCHQYGITNIDYMNLDVEGHELEVLKAFNFSNTNIKIISIESGPKDAKIQKFLEEKGYLRITISSSIEEQQTIDRFMGYDMLFRHKSVTIGSPS